MPGRFFRGTVFLAALALALASAAGGGPLLRAAAGEAPAPDNGPDAFLPEWPEGFKAFPEDPWIAFNRAKGEVRVAAALSDGLIQLESPLDFLLVSGVRTEDGYWHYERGYESVFVTRARPDSLFFALMLSGLKPGDAPLPDARNANSAGHVKGAPLPPDAGPKTPATRLRILVEWRDADGGRQVAPAEHFYRDRATGKPPTDTVWLFTGSYLVEGGPERGRYLAALDSRVLAATFFDETALLNRAGESVNPYQSDGGFSVAAEALPPEFRRTRVAEYGEEKRTIWLPRPYPATLIFTAAE